MKKIKVLSITLLFCLVTFVSTAQWNVAPNGTLSTSELVLMEGEVRITGSHVPLYMKTGFESFIDLSILQNGSVGYLGGSHANFVWGMWGGLNGAGPRPAFRVGKVVGTEWNAIGYLSTAIGEDVGAMGNYTLSVGYGSRANGNYSVALGSSTASGIYATSLGNSSAGGSYSFAAGSGTANANYSVALNDAAVNNGAYSTALNKSLSDGNYSLAAGSSYTSGEYSTALNYSQTGPKASYSLASGYLSGAYGARSTAMGNSVNASGYASMILGSNFSNKIDNSLMVAFNCKDVPSIFVGPGTGDEKGRFGFVGIGTTTPTYELSVNGTIVAKTAVLVENLPGQWPDYVFSDNYELTSLGETEEFIKANRHLPGVPSADEIAKEGLNLGEMEMILMKKIEEITLHLIELEKDNELLREELTNLKNKN